MSSVHSANKAFKSLKQLLNREQRLRTRFISWFSALIAMADIVGLSSMVPVLMLAIDHSFLEKSSKLRALYTFFHFESEPQFLKALIAIIILFFLVKNVAAIWLMRYVRKTAIDIASTLSSKSYQYAFRNNSYGQVASDGLGFNDTVLFTPFYYVSGIYLPLLNIVSESAVVLMLVAVFTIYKPILFLLIAGLLGVGFFLVNRYTRKKITQLGEQGSQMREAALKDLNFGVSGFTDIRIHGVEDFFRDKFLVHFTGFAKNGVKAISYQLIPARINEFVALMGIVALVIYGYFYSQENLGQVRVLAALFAISVFRLIPAANRLLQALMHLKLNGYTIDKLMPVAVEAPVKAQAAATFSHDLELRQVCYGYENAHHTVLENVNLHISKGSIIGLSGASGAGKSTLVKILMGMYAPSKGEVLLDGARVENQEQVMSLFGFMGQDPYLLNATVRENVAFGIPKDEIEDERVRQCIEQASLHIEGVSDILELTVGEGAAMLSEGQKQRLVLARELYRNVPILVLDEPTSALDATTESEVMETFLNLSKAGKTLIIVAHSPRIINLCTSVYQLSGKTITKIER